MKRREKSHIIPRVAMYISLLLTLATLLWQQALAQESAVVLGEPWFLEAKPSNLEGDNGAPWPVLAETSRPLSYTVGLPLVKRAVQPEDGFAAQVVALVNEERVQAGCPALATDARLTEAAVGHSADMAVNDFFSHTGSDGSTPAERVEEQGYGWLAIGENIAVGYPTAEAVVAGWMGSAGHRANILNCGYTETGVGYVYLADDEGRINYHHYWTHVFARPSD